MSVPSGCGKWVLPGFLLVLFVLLSACAGKESRFDTILENEGLAARRAFDRMRKQVCGASLDAEVDVSFSASSFLGDRKGAVSGYLLAAEPAKIKFVVVNPFGQPMLLFASDGHRFRTLVVPEGKSYEGALQAEKVREYGPAGFAEEPVFDWLTGRIAPELDSVTVLGRTTEEDGIWLEVRDSGGGKEKNRSQILIDPALGYIKKRILLDDKDEVLMDVRFSDFQDIGPEGCRLPGVVEIAALPHNGRVVLEMYRVESPARDLTEQDFYLSVPSGYEKIEVK